MRSALTAAAAQGASKTNISLVVEGKEGQRCVRALHTKFFEAQQVL
jgi:aspartokinase